MEELDCPQKISFDYLSLLSPEFQELFPPDITLIVAPTTTMETPTKSTNEKTGKNGNHLIRTYRFLLVSLFEYFERMFQSNMVESRLSEIHLLDSNLTPGIPESIYDKAKHSLRNSIPSFPVSSYTDLHSFLILLGFDNINRGLSGNNNLSL